MPLFHEYVIARTFARFGRGESEWILVSISQIKCSKLKQGFTPGSFRSLDYPEKQLMARPETSFNCLTKIGGTALCATIYPAGAQINQVY